MVHMEIWKQEQQSIGWMNFLSGFISKAMVVKQQQHYQELGLWNKGKHWASNIISQKEFVHSIIIDSC